MKGWAAIAALVIALDAHASSRRRPTLSCTYRQAAHTHPFLIGTVLPAYLLAHLWGLLPRHLDPLSRWGYQ